MSTEICTWLEDFLFSNLWFCLDLRQHFTVSYPGSELSMILLPWLPREGVAGVGHFVQFDNLISITVGPTLPGGPDLSSESLLHCLLP